MVSLGHLHPRPFSALHLGSCPGWLTSMWAPLLELNQWEAQEEGKEVGGERWSPWFWLWLSSSEDTCSSGETYFQPRFSPASITPFLLCILLQAGYRFSLLLVPGSLTFTWWFVTSAHTSANGPFLQVSSAAPRVCQRLSCWGSG